MVVPQFVCLDSSTLGKLAKDRTASSGATEVVAVLNSGEILLFLTWQHIEELLQHRNCDVYRARIDFLCSLRMIGFPTTGVGGIGGFLELRDHEFNSVLALPHGSFAEIIERTRDLVRSGFDTGEHLCMTQREFWDHYREHFAEHDLQNKVEIASLAHFPVADPKRRYPIRGTQVRLKPKPKAEAAFVQMATALAARMQEAGDPRVHDSRRLAFSLLKEAFDEVQPLYDKPDFCVQDLLSVYGVDASRLPSKPLVEDVSYEGIFAQHLRQFGRRSLKDRDTSIVFVVARTLVGALSALLNDTNSDITPFGGLSTSHTWRLAPFSFMCTLDSFCTSMQIRRKVRF
jgi:hypothetical protein